jgi:hypothetical protein
MDKVTIGVTPENDQVVSRLIELGLFDKDFDVAKFAMGLAVSRDMPLADVPGVGTKWNIGSFDRDGQLRNLLLMLYPDASEPYRTIENLINVGLQYLSKEWAGRGEMNARVLLSLTSAEGDKDL